MSTLDRDKRTLKEMPESERHKVHNYEILVKHLEKICSQKSEFQTDKLEKPQNPVPEEAE